MENLKKSNENLKKGNEDPVEGKYIYCIIYASEYQSFGPMGIGDREDELYTISFNGIAAAVSNTPIKKYALTRKNSMAHELAIEEIMKKVCTVLPVRFATIAEGEKEGEKKVKKILEAEYDRFTRLLKDMEDKKELGLKAIFLEDVIYKDILKKSESIRLMKEQLAKLSPEKTYFKRIDLGRQVEDRLNKEKEKCKKEILDILSPLAEKVKNDETYSERMIMNTAFLVKKEKERKFDQMVKKIGQKYDHKIHFKYVGNVPPFNFISLKIDTRNY